MLNVSSRLKQVHALPLKASSSVKQLHARLNMQQV